MKPIFWKLKMLVCTLGGEGGRGLKKCTVCTLMKMLTFLDGPLACCGKPPYYASRNVKYHTSWIFHCMKFYLRLIYTPANFGCYMKTFLFDKCAHLGICQCFYFAWIYTVVELWRLKVLVNGKHIYINSWMYVS